MLRYRFALNARTSQCNDISILTAFTIVRHLLHTDFCLIEYVNNE